jgi:hypothetical protein
MFDPIHCKPGMIVRSETPYNETVHNLGVITPHFETNDVPIAPRRRNPC